MSFIYDPSGGGGGAGITDGDKGDITVSSSGAVWTIDNPYTDEKVQDNIGAAFVDSSTLDYSYNDGAGTMTVDIKSNCITAAMINDVELAAIGGLTSAANKIPRFTGSGTADLLDFKDEDDMNSDSASAVPSQQSVKAYVDTEIAGVVGGSVNLGLTSLIANGFFIS